MKCCVQNCVNSGNVKKINQSSTCTNKRITYHLFPKDPEQRETWLKSLAIPDLMLTNRTVICSDHFKEEDFCITKQGTRRIKNGMVPFIQDDCYEPAALRVCKLCLSIDSKMYQIRDHGLDKMYEHIMGIPPRMDAQKRLPMSICWECTARLQSASAFKSKALFSDALLKDHLKNNADLKIIDIQNILQSHTHLKSSISIQEVFKLNSHDIDDYAPNTFMKTEVIGIPDNEEIEVEAQDLARNKNNIKNERKNELIVKNLPNTDFKTEVNRKPITEIDSGDDETSIGDHISDDDVEAVTENVHVNKTSTGFVKALKNEKEIESVDIAANLSETMETEDDDLAKKDDDDDATSNDSSDEDLKKNHTNKTVGAKKKRSYPAPTTPIDENIFAVKKLNHDDLRREILTRRDSDKYIYSPYKCDVCYTGFTTKERKERHMIKHSEQSGPYKCNICHVRMKTPRYFREHMNRTHTMEYMCKQCPMVTRLRTVAIGHMKYHAGNTYKCPQCSVEFEKSTTLQSHLRLKHMSACVCELCGYTFVSKKGVHIHKRITHRLFDPKTKFKGPHCDVCDVKFLSDKAYKLHLRLSSKHITEDDPKRMSNDSSVKPRRFDWGNWVKPVKRPVIHLRNENTPVNNGPITCEQCGVVLESLQEYASHFKYAHPGVTRIQSTYASTPYMCEHCGKFFLNSTTLSCHMWVHTGQKLFQCDHCNKTFSMKGKLAHHIRHEHEGPRRTYGCPDCGKRFTFNYNLTRHMMIHTGLKPFKCELCEKTFSTSGELRAHVVYVHLKKPRPKRAKRKTVKYKQAGDDDDDN